METWNSCTVARNRRDNGDMEQLYSCQEQEKQWRHGTAVRLPGTGETMETWNSCAVARNRRDNGDMEQLYSCQDSADDGRKILSSEPSPLPRCHSYRSLTYLRVVFYLF